MLALKRILFIISVSLILSSCGFHLRGKIDSDQLLSVKGLPVYLSVTSQDKKLFRQLKRDFQLADYSVVDEPLLSKNHLVILNSSLTKRAVGVDSFGRNNEFEIIVGIEFIVNRLKVENENLKSSSHNVLNFENSLEAESTILTTHRNLYRDSYDSIGKNAEESSLLDSMRQELSLKIMSQFTATIHELERIEKKTKEIHESRFPQ